MPVPKGVTRDWIELRGSCWRVVEPGQAAAWDFCAYPLVLVVLKRNGKQSTFFATRTFVLDDPDRPSSEVMRLLDDMRCRARASGLEERTRGEGSSWFAYRFEPTTGG